MRRGIIALASLSMAIAAVQVQACLVNIQVEAKSGEFSGVSSFLASTTDTQGWELSAPVAIYAGSELVGYLDELILNTKDDPEVSVEFGVRATSTGSTFHITVSPVTFDSIMNPEACASGGVTVTDRKGSTAGATMTGLFGGKIYRTTYNGTTIFTDMISNVSTSGAAPATATALDDLCGIISGAVSSINIEAYFGLTANDSASGTATFIVTPEPVTMSLLGLGALLAVRRK